MKIAILADPLDNQKAGVHYYTAGMVRALLQYDKGNDYIILRQKLDNQFPENIQLIVPHRSWIPGYKAFRLLIAIPWALRKKKVDMVIEPAHFGPWNLSSKTTRVTVIHDLTPLIFPKYHPFHSSLLQRIFLKGILRRAQLVITNSKNTNKDLLAEFPFCKGKNLMAYPGRDDFFSPREKAPTSLPKDTNYLLFFGTLEPRKNLGILLEAYTLLKKQHPSNLKLILGGQMGWKNTGLKKQLEAHPFKEDILRIGYCDREEMARLYSHCKVFIYPSEYEGFGLPILEAMSCGAPVLLAENSSLPEVGGRVAEYFSTLDSNDLFEKIKSILAQDQTAKDKAKTIYQSEQFDWKEYAELLIEEFDSFKKSI